MIHLCELLNYFIKGNPEGGIVTRGLILNIKSVTVLMNAIKQIMIRYSNYPSAILLLAIIKGPLHDGFIPQLKIYN